MILRAASATAFIGASLADVIPDPQNQYNRLVVERDVDGNISSEELWEPRSNQGSDELFYCKAFNGNNGFPITCGCLNNGLNVIDASFNDDIIYSIDFTEDIYNDMINGNLNWPDCIQHEEDYLTMKFDEINRLEIEQSPEEQQRQARMKERYERRVAEREAKILKRKEDRQNNKITMRTMQNEANSGIEECREDDEACLKRLRLKATRTCEDNYDIYWKNRQPGKHCCHKGKFYLQYKIFMDLPIQQEHRSPFGGDISDSFVGNTWAEKQHVMNNIWQSQMFFSNNDQSLGSADISGLEGLLDAGTLDEIDNDIKKNKSKNNEDKLAAVCLAGKIEYFEEAVEKRCSRVKEIVISKIKQHNVENPLESIEIWDHEKSNPNKLYIFDESKNIIIKKALTLVCPEGYHFYAEELKQKRYTDWTCGGGTGQIKAVFPKCIKNQKLGQEQIGKSAFLDDNELGALLDESSHIFGAIDKDDFLQFVLQTNPDLAPDLQFVEDSDEEDLGISERILGGVRVPTMTNPMYPWQVFLDMYERGFCGGVIMTERLFFTAAHCIKAGNLLQSTYRQKVRAYVGITHKSEIKKSNEYTLVECKVHADYRISSQIMQNDIAYCIVDRDFDFSGPNPKVAPACLPDRPIKNYRNTNCYATGFGTLSEGATRGSEELMAVKVAIKPMVECQAEYNTEVKSDYHLCAGGNQGYDSCQGDSGGPFVCEIPDDEATPWQLDNCKFQSGNNPDKKVVKILSGIISFGKGCGRANVPGVYVNVWNENYRQFIGSTLNATLQDPYIGGDPNLLSKRSIPAKEKIARMGQIISVDGYNNYGYPNPPVTSARAQAIARLIAAYRAALAQKQAQQRQLSTAAKATRQASSSSSVKTKGSKNKKKVKKVKRFRGRRSISKQDQNLNKAMKYSKK